MQLPFKITINERSFDITPEDVHVLDISTISDNETFHILDDNKSYKVELISHDASGKNLMLRINGNTYTTKLSDKYDRLIDQLGMKVVGSQSAGDIKAPMPGLVLDILVEVGQTVSKGDKVLILEAMKMENIIKTTGDGIIKAIHAQKGKPVDKGTLLIELL